MPNTLIIGAGLSGLIAARHLAEVGHAVTVVDKGRSVGGRLATRRIGDAVLDHGAQFFTVRSEEFRVEVDQWLAAGVATEWCRGFSEDDGYPRYVGTHGMNAIAKHLATLAQSSGVDIVTGVRAACISAEQDAWLVRYEADTRATDLVDHILTTAPVPQSFALLDAGAVAIEPDAAGVRQLEYHPVIGLLATVDTAPDFGRAGALQQPDDPTFTFVANNASKGISHTPAVTFHVAHARSAQLWDTPDDEIHNALLPAATALLGNAVIQESQVKKWLYAGPVMPWPERFATLAKTPGQLLIAGDAFGGPKVEGAFLSGLAAAGELGKAVR